MLCLFPATMAPEILELTTCVLRVVVLFLVEKFELSLESIFQFFGAIEKEEWNLDTFCDPFETRRVGSLGVPPVCWSRFGMSGHSRYLGMDAQGTLKSWFESNMAKDLESANACRWMTDVGNVQAVVLFLVEASIRKVERSALGDIVFHYLPHETA